MSNFQNALGLSLWPSDHERDLSPPRLHRFTPQRLPGTGILSEMRYLLSSLICVMWGLWFGGTIMLFIAVQSLFHTFADNRPLAGTAASGIFHVFEQYQLMLAALILLSCFGWRMMAGGAGVKNALFAVFALAAIPAVISALNITPRLEELRRIGLSNGPQFRHLHGVSMMLFMAQAIVLLGAGMLLVFIARRDAVAGKI
jgi:hypothetical protein